MIINTKAYGEMEIEAKQVYHFLEGIPAFERYKEWALIEARQQPFYILQSLEDVEVAFFLLDPWICREDYQVRIEAHDLERLGVKQEQMTGELKILGILSIPVGEPKMMSINLQAPLVFCTLTRQAMQIVLHDDSWMVRHLVAKELEGKGKVLC